MGEANQTTFRCLWPMTCSIGCHFTLPSSYAKITEV